MNLPAWKTSREIFAFTGGLVLVARLVACGVALVYVCGWLWDGLAYFNIIALGRALLATLPAKLWALTGF